jgi:hypothetical protein
MAVPKQLVPPLAAPTATLHTQPGVAVVVATTYPAPPPPAPIHKPDALRPDPPPPNAVTLTSETPVGIVKDPEEPKNLKEPVPYPGLISL